MMQSLVLALQHDALNEGVSTIVLLRKALVVAKKLDVGEIQEWLSDELNGYPQGKKVPDYRYLRGELKVFNPYRGWMPLYFGNPRDAELLSRKATSQSIAELERLGTSEAAYMPFAPEIEKKLMDGMEIPLQPALHISTTQISAIVERVRNTILEWALSLEKRGILGEGMAFTPQEKETAHSVYHIGNFIGSMADSQIQQDIQHSSQTYQKSIDIEAVRGILGELQSRRDELRLAAEDRRRLEELLERVGREVESPNPKTSVVRESLSSIRSIVEGAAGSALFQGIVIALGALA
jgi:hypothetical protein